MATDWFISIKLSPNAAEAHFWVAKGKHQLGFFNNSLESYSESIRLNSDYGEAYYYRGALKVSMKKRKGACDDFRIANNLKVEGAAAALTKYCK